MSKVQSMSEFTESISLADEPAVKEVLVNTIFGLWDIVNNLTRLRPSKEDRYRVTIFGSARIQPDSPSYQEVKAIAAALSQLDCDIVTGGGPGLMQAANEGAASAHGDNINHSVGIRVNLPFEQQVNPFVTQAYTHKTFFTRLHHFVLMSNAFIVTPGGIGTVLELMMVWQLLQVKHVPATPLILVGPMWGDLLDWARTHFLTTQPPLAGPEDLAIPHCVSTAEEAIAVVREHRARWGNPPAVAPAS